MELCENTDVVNAAGYAASKAGLIQLAKWYATSLAPNIRVNTISPGGILEDIKNLFYQSILVEPQWLVWAREEDTKGAAIFLASDLSAYVTGQNIIVDGGLTVM